MTSVDARLGRVLGELTSAREQSIADLQAEEQARVALETALAELERDEKQSGLDTELALKRAEAQCGVLEAELEATQTGVDLQEEQLRQRMELTKALQTQVDAQLARKKLHESKVKRRQEQRDITAIDKLTLKRICEHLTPADLCAALGVCSRWYFHLNRGFLYKAVLGTVMRNEARRRYRKGLERARVQRYVDSAPLQVMIKLQNVSKDGVEQRSSVLTDLKKIGNKEKPNKAALFTASLAQLQMSVSVAKSEMEDRAAALQADISVRTALKANLQANVDQISQCQVRKANAIWSVGNTEKFKLDTAAKLDELEHLLNEARDHREREMGRLAAEMESLTMQVTLVKDARQKAAHVKEEEKKTLDEQKEADMKSRIKKHKQHKRNSVREIKKLQSMIEHERQRESVYLQKALIV
jgi:hypothetical protein